MRGIIAALFFMVVAACSGDGGSTRSGDVVQSTADTQASSDATGTSQGDDVLEAECAEDGFKRCIAVEGASCIETATCAEASVCESDDDCPAEHECICP